ncbi:MAG: DUF411 domain-containing protein [Pseudomonadota bacterium]|uniref:DUF411 domain-containing protein n=1 Tax=Gallaecimonas pentaromativorans TaxID=584787 RepID=UPI00067EC430|nr:DUF411 domain-containing protein [Gallaecimonas pentaromativorans]MED5523713.1 DUF411 domain-containing protein [Pseudomonadota bacterium]
MYRFKLTGSLLGLLMLPLLVACNDGSEDPKNSDPSAADADMLTVYKSPTCGCCKKWIGHLEAEGFEASAEHPASLDDIKDRYRIANNLRSCHTAVSSQGYVFEGHIPGRYIHQFLANPPADATGLAVPAMPVGSPGMEVGVKFMPYQVLLMKKDGSTEVFASVESMAEQYQPFDQQEVRP